MNKLAALSPPEVLVAAFAGLTLSSIGYQIEWCKRNGATELAHPQTGRPVRITALLSEVRARMKHPWIAALPKYFARSDFGAQDTMDTFASASQKTNAMLAWGMGLRRTLPSFTVQEPGLLSEALLVWKNTPEQLVGMVAPPTANKVHAALQQTAAWRIRAEAVYYVKSVGLRKMKGEFKKQAVECVNSVPKLVKLAKASGWVDRAEDDFPYAWVGLRHVDPYELEQVIAVLEAHLFGLRIVEAALRKGPLPDCRLGYAELSQLIWEQSA